MARAPQPDPIRVSDEARALLPDGPEVQKLLDRYATWGFRRVYVRDGQLVISGPRFFVSATLFQRDAVQALEEGQAKARQMDLFARLILASGDMLAVWETAKFLATEEFERDTLTDPAHPMARVLMLGLVTMYCRPFTGRASLPARYRPQGERPRELHDLLMLARGLMYAHSDHTAMRGLRYDGGEELPVPFEYPLGPEVHAEIADMAADLNNRYRDEVDRLFEELREGLTPTQPPP